MTTITIDLTKDPEVAALLADKEPGAKVCGCFTVKSRDDQTAVLRIQSMADTCDELKSAMADDEEGEDTADDEGDEGEDAPVAAPKKSMGERMASSMSGSEESM